jgi:spermidine/putrescine transport system substrate-binding protein
MRKPLTSLRSIALLAGIAGITLSGCNMERKNVLRICNWEDYIDQSLLAEFEMDYMRKTGNVKFKVEYSTYDTPTALFSKILQNKDDYDLVMLTDFEVSRYIDNELLLPLNPKHLPAMSVYQPWLTDLDFDKGNIYSRPYSYGILGLLYNPRAKDVDPNDMKSWEALWNHKYNQRITLKNNYSQDLFAVAALYAYRDRLRVEAENFTYPRRYSVVLTDILKSHTGQTIRDVSRALRMLRLLVADSLTYNARHSFVENQNNDLGLFWSNDAAYVMTLNRTMEFTVPMEGSTMYVESWCIPKYAKNEAAAHAFMEFVARKDIAKRNIRATAAASSLASTNEEYKAELENNEVLFVGQTPEWKRMYIETLFPPERTRKRCWIHEYTADHTDAVEKIVSGIKEERY